MFSLLIEQHSFDSTWRVDNNKKTVGRYKRRSVSTDQQKISNESIKIHEK